MNQPQRYVFLDGLRGLAAIAVVFLHYSYNLNTGKIIFASANLAVDLFFCLSGFVVALAYSDRLANGMSLSSFLKKRFIRLYPMFAIGLIIGTAALLMKYQVGQLTLSLQQITTASILNVLYLPYFNAESINVFDRVIDGNIFPANSPAWSLFFEIIINIAFVFLIRLRNIHLLIMVVVMAVWLTYSSLTTHSTPGWGMYNFAGGFPRVGYSFLVGVLIYRYSGKFTFSPNLHPLTILFGLALLLLVPRNPFFIEYWLLATLFAVPVIVWIGVKTHVQNATSAKILHLLGWLSYPLYCLHVPIMYLVSVKFSQPNNPWAMFLALLIGSLGLTWAIAKYYDEPVRAWLTKKYG